MDLKESARQWVLNFLPYNRSDGALIAHLEQLDARELLITYHNWITRLVRRRPRSAHVSTTLQRKISGHQHERAIRRIIDNIQKGRDLTKYLSRGIRIAAQLPRDDIKYNKRLDLDLMLTSWQMHHLHLSGEVDPDGFVKRTGDLLFCVFRPDDAYLVDVMPHGSWSKDELLKVALDELPESQAVHVLQGVVGLARHYTEDEHQELRNAGINTIRMLGERAVHPAGSITGAGTSYQASRDADRAILLFEGFEASWAGHPDKVRAICRENGTELPEEPEFVFTITENVGAGILEKKSKAFFPFPVV